MIKMKKAITLFLSLIMLFASSALPFYAFADESITPAMEKSPFYSGEEVSYSSLDSYSLPSSKSRKFNSKTYYSEGQELYKIIRNKLEKRTTDFKINYLLSARVRSTRQAMNIIKKLWVLACDDSISESSTDGDYIAWAVSEYGFITFINDNFDGETYYYTINLQFNYYDTAEQEKKVDAVVNNFVSKFDTNSLSDYEIIKEIHDFICSKTTYDNAAARSIDGREYAASAYGALVKGRCVCQGYAVAFYRLCKELGYNARFVSSAQDEGCHAWNIVQLDGKYYFVDTTWDDTNIDKNLPYSPYQYFLVDYETSRESDSVYNEHKLDELYYDTEYFWENYRELIDEKSYNPENKNLFSQCVISLSGDSFTYTGSSVKPTINIKSDGEVQSYKCSYLNNKNTGRAAVNITGVDGSVPLSHRNFIIIPKKMTSLSLADSGRATSSIKVKWSKAPGSVSGYTVEVYKDGKWKTAKTVSSSSASATVSSLSAATTYKFRIRSFVTVCTRNYYGAYSSEYKTATKPKTPKASSISTKSKSVTLKWEKVSCSGYEIQYSANKSMKNAKTITASSKAVSKKISKLKKGKKYYVRVRAYKNYTSASKNNCKSYSSWSTKKSIKCK